MAYRHQNLEALWRKGQFSITTLYSHTDNVRFDFEMCISLKWNREYDKTLIVGGHIVETNIYLKSLVQ